MPYIKSERRKELSPKISPLLSYLDKEIISEGDMNYIITKICQKSMLCNSYSEYNKIIGILECVKLEFYRRAVAPYEDKKIKENGDVYDNFL